MASPPTLLQHLRRLIGSPGPAGATDDQLLRRFVNGGDDAAFELLVWRHGPMVLNVCGRVLRDEHLAEDAFQATFLQLARKAGSIGRGEALAGWLYQVAYRTAVRARRRAEQAVVRERPLLDLPVPAAGVSPDEEAAWRELRPVLDDEVRRLPEKYRSVFILCCLEGMTNEQAAQELGCPKGTVLSRLSRARERLKKRLERRNLAAWLFLPLMSRCGEWILSQEQVTALMKLVASPAPATAFAPKKWGLGNPGAVLAAAAGVLVLTVSSGGAIYYLSPGQSTAGKSVGAGCPHGGACHVTAPASAGSTQPADER